MLRLRKRPRNGGEGSGSIDFAASTPLSTENRYPSQTQQIDQFIHKKKNHNYNNDMVETSSDQLPQQSYESMIRVPHK